MRRYFAPLPRGAPLDRRSGFSRRRRRRVGGKNVVVVLCDSRSKISDSDLSVDPELPFDHRVLILLSPRHRQNLINRRRIHMYEETHDHPPPHRPHPKEQEHHTSTQRTARWLTFCITSIGSSFLTFKINLASSKLICS